jgi:hypothetical protein
VQCDALPAGDACHALEQWAQTLCAQAGRRFAGVRPYRRGASFLRVQA